MRPNRYPVININTIDRTSKATPLKKKLIEEVSNIIESNKISENSKRLKIIQEEWKKIGYLPRKISNSLWNEFKPLVNKYYNILKNMNYEGIVVRFMATSVETNEEIELSETEYNLYKKTKAYKDFREENTESRYPEIIKNIALIYSQLGDNENAMKAVKEARENDPKDLSLILTEANLYIQLKENDRFEALMKEAIEQDPNNATLYFNLGVVNAQRGNKEDASKYYRKTIELDPEFESGYLNLVTLILQGENAIVEKMNGLGTSRADNARYDELKLEREQLYSECVPILEKLVGFSKNQEAVKTLMNIYGTLGDNEGFMKMKGMIE